MYILLPKSVIEVGAIVPALATIAVSLRFYVRLSKASSVDTDDWLILFSLVRLSQIPNAIRRITLTPIIRFSPLAWGL